MWWLDHQSIRKRVEGEHPPDGQGSRTLAPGHKRRVKRKMMWIKNIHKLTGNIKWLSWLLGTWKKQECKVKNEVQRRSTWMNLWEDEGFCAIG